MEGIGDKIGIFFQWFSTFIFGISVGFYYGWKLAAVIMSVSPLLVICGYIMNKVMYLKLNSVTFYSCNAIFSALSVSI